MDHHFRRHSHGFPPHHVGDHRFGCRKVRQVNAHLGGFVEIGWLNVEAKLLGGIFKRLVPIIYFAYRSVVMFETYIC